MFAGVVSGPHAPVPRPRHGDVDMHLDGACSELVEVLQGHGIGEHLVAVTASGEAERCGGFDPKATTVVVGEFEPSRRLVCSVLLGHHESVILLVDRRQVLPESARGKTIRVRFVGPEPEPPEMAERRVDGEHQPRPAGRRATARAR